MTFHEFVRLLEEQNSTTINTGKTHGVYHAKAKEQEQEVRKKAAGRRC